MPADLGTKPVGPTRLEDLLKICDLMTPHLQSDEEPPRPTVATVTSAPSGFMSTFLALITLAQVVEARAVKLQVEGSMGEALAFGFMMGFGIGCGLWFAKWVERCIHRCWCPPREGNIGPQSRVRPNVSRKLQVIVKVSLLRASLSKEGLVQGELRAFMTMRNCLRGSFKMFMCRRKFRVVRGIRLKSLFPWLMER